MEYKRLGDYIREVNARNRELKVTKPMGINIDKHFMPSVANVIGTDLSAYKLVSKNQFACNLMHVGRDERIPMAMQKDDNPIIVSPAYFVFEITQSETLMPEYLMMWFSRPEFDRNAWFYTDADVRGGMDKNAFMDMTLPEATAQALYRKMFVDNIDKENLPAGWRMGTIIDFGEVITGKTPSSENPEDFGEEMPFVTPGDFANYRKFAISAERYLSDIGIKRLKGKVLPKGSVIVTCIGSDMGKVVIASEECITNQQMNSIVVKHGEYSDYLYYVLSSMTKELKAMALGSSTMPLLNKSDFEKIAVIFPSSNLLMEFSQIITVEDNMLLLKLKENLKLMELQSLLLAKMGQ